MVTKQKIKYWAKYTGASYLDLILSAPISAAESIARTSQRMLGNRTPKLLTLEDIHQNSPTYNSRQNLRNNLDTRPGSVFLQSNIIGAIPFFLAGMPAAEGAQALIERYLSNTPEIAQYATNSLATLGVQMVVGYTTFMLNEIRTNKQKYVTNNKLDAEKIKQGFLKAFKAFLSFDLTYIGLKTAGQSGLLALGKDPAIASGLFDSLALPAWYTIAIPLSLERGVIETKETTKNRKP